ncbi:MAG: glycoside hydrolase family 2 TIM barrel-domain containing protein [Vicinamibacterales bacterium]
MPLRPHPVPPAGGRGYPRPQMQREHWTLLDGQWEAALDRTGRWRTPDQVHWSTRILVPFSPETPRSGIGDESFYEAVWYRRTVETPVLTGGERWVLHFGAVDHHATVWVDGRIVGEHRGGYTPFAVDLTAAIAGAPGSVTLVVRAEDSPQDLAKPRGKQDWQLEPHSIWYPRTSGIWQSVWSEVVPATRIGAIRWTPNLERWEIGFEAWVHGEPRERLRVRVHLFVGDTLIADDTMTVVAGEVHRRIALSDPGIDDYRNELLWSPDKPTLIDAEIELWGERGERLDVLRSYTALRSIAAQRDRFLLNGRPYQMRLVLDQGYWPDTGLTAPDDEAIERDVRLAKAMGFNGVRKHQKLEDPRYLYWADRLGLLVWEEMPSAYRFTHHSVELVTQEWTEALARDYSHPCIVAWVPFNESWGVPNLPESARERHYVQALYHLTRTLDPTRLVIGNDGWESVATDMIGIHDYDDDPTRIARRYQADEVLPRLFRRERPGGRLLVLQDQPAIEQPIVLSEFGGIAYSPDERTWGYTRCQTADALEAQYTALLDVVRELPVLCGFCYTQFADTYQEANGLLFADRTPKFPIASIAKATRGRQGRGGAVVIDPIEAASRSETDV